MKTSFIILTSIVLLIGCCERSVDSKSPDPDSTYTATLYSRDGNIVNTWSNLSFYYRMKNGQVYELYLEGNNGKKNCVTVTVGEGQMIVSPEGDINYQTR